MYSPIGIFDIDGVLATPEPKIHFNSYIYAIKEIFGVETSLEGLDFHGTTDRWVIYALSRKKGIDDKRIDDNIDRIFKIMGDYYEQNIKTSTIEPLEGVEELLREFYQKNFVMGVLTGNIRRIAICKLKKLNLDKYFTVGSYGDISKNRIDLFNEVISQVEEKVGKVDKKRLFYFDDSINGLKVGKDAGFRTIGVATGIYPYEKLMEIKPDFILEDLSDLKRVLDLIR